MIHHLENSLLVRDVCPFLGCAAELGRGGEWGGGEEKGEKQYP